MTHAWSGSTYDRVSDPQARWGASVLEWLDLRGSERVLDAGCGSGRVTEQLVQRLPRGKVVGVDFSPEMLEEAGRRLAPYGERVSLTKADLTQPLAFDDPFDGVFSTATFHWILDHDALFRHLAAVLHPRGQLVAQCGGKGNIAAVAEAAREVWDWQGWSGPWQYASPEETRVRLEAAGFVGVSTWLQEEPTDFSSRQDFEVFLESVVLGAHLERVPAHERKRIVQEVSARLPRAHLDYVRLNIVARRA